MGGMKQRRKRAASWAACTLRYPAGPSALEPHLPLGGGGAGGGEGRLAAVGGGVGGGEGRLARVASGFGGLEGGLAGVQVLDVALLGRGAWERGRGEGEGDQRRRPEGGGAGPACPGGRWDGAPHTLTHAPAVPSICWAISVEGGPLRTGMTMGRVPPRTPPALPRRLKHPETHQAPGGRGRGGRACSPPQLGCSWWGQGTGWGSGQEGLGRLQRVNAGGMDGGSGEWGCGARLKWAAPAADSAAISHSPPHGPAGRTKESHEAARCLHSASATASPLGSKNMM